MNNNYIVEEPNDREQAGSIFGGIYYPQMRAALSRQVNRCPDGLPDMLDESTGLASDGYFNAAWTSQAPVQHYMQQILVRIAQLETRNPAIRSGGNKGVTNVLASNDKNTTVQITAWEPHHRRLEALQIGQVSENCRFF